MADSTDGRETGLVYSSRREAQADTDDKPQFITSTYRLSQQSIYDITATEAVTSRYSSDLLNRRDG